MKQFLSLLVLAVLSASAYGQFGIEEPELHESELKTQFSHSYFRANYRTQKVLVRFLEQDHAQISTDSRSFKVVATDLYYTKSAHYRNEKKLPAWLTNTYLTSEKEKREKLDSAFGDRKKWATAFVENNLVDEVLKPIMNGYDITIDKHTIYLTTPESRGASDRVIYRFAFNDDKSILSQDLGRLVRGQDSLYWITSTYSYKKRQLQQVVNKKCNDVRCERGYELVTDTYTDGLLTKSVKQTFSRNNNELIKEEITDRTYTKGVRDSATTREYYLVNSKADLYYTKTDRYQAERITSTSESWTSPQATKDQYSFIEHTYDDQDRLIQSNYKGWDQQNDTTQLRTEEYEYAENKYVYRYRESLKKERGNEKLPLQYEMTYTFF